MSRKSEFVVSARSGGRSDKATVDRAGELFISTGRLVSDNALVVAEVINMCMQRQVAFTFSDYLDHWELTRVHKGATP